MSEVSTSRRAVMRALAIIPAAIVTPAIAAHGQAFRPPFDVALARYRQLRAASDAMPLGHPDEDAAIEACCEAMDYLIEKVPSPDGQALALKIEIARPRCEGFGMFDEYLDAFAADARRLSGEAMA